MKPPKLAEIAARIGAHLKRFEADPKVNRVFGKFKTHTYYCVECCTSGPRVFVTYVGYQGNSSLTKAEALAYLEWLDAGGVGKHWDAKRKTVGERVKEIAK